MEELGSTPAPQQLAGKAETQEAAGNFNPLITFQIYALGIPLYSLKNAKIPSRDTLA